MEMLTPKYTVEELSVTDMMWFADVACVRMLTEEAKRPELVDKKQLFNLAYLGMEKKTAWVAKKDGECIGAVGAYLVPNMFNPKFKTLAEIVWYVLPEHRSSRAGAMLLKTFIEAGDRLADDTVLSLLPSSEINHSSLIKKGFHLEEFGFRKKNK